MNSEVNEFFKNDINIFSGWDMSGLNNTTEYLSIDGLLEKRDKWDRYIFNDIGVPRVTEIIRDTIGKDYLTKWAANLGVNYENESKSILDTGTKVHSMIEDFITTGTIKEEYPNCDNADHIKSMRAFNNFRNFWRDIHNRGYTITPYFLERPIVTPWFGGTMDLCSEITFNGISKLFIIDFKTSNSISFEYFLQTRLYMEAFMFLKYNNLDFGELPDIDGIGIIRVDKNSDKYEYVFADKYTDKTFLDTTLTAAYSMLDWYYKLNGMKILTRDFKRMYSGRGGINGLYQ